MQAFHYIKVMEDYICFQQKCLPKSKTNLSWSAGKAGRYLRSGLAYSGRADPASNSWHRQPILAGELRG